MSVVIRYAAQNQSGQRNLRPMKDGPGGQRNLVPALGALMASLVHQFIGSLVPASRTNEAIRPTTRRQVLLAGLLGGEVGSETDEASWGTAAEAPLYTTYWGLLKQPDNQKH